MDSAGLHCTLRDVETNGVITVLTLPAGSAATVQQFAAEVQAWAKRNLCEIVGESYDPLYCEP